MKYILTILLTLSFAYTASATSENPWTHCGLGAMIFPKVPVAAGISNILWDLGTTAVSSKVSSADSCSGKTVAMAKFLNETYASVEMEAVQGSGAHLNAMLDIIKCDDSSKTAVINDTKAGLMNRLNNNYDSLSHNDKAFALYTDVLNSAANNCGA